MTTQLALTSERLFAVNEALKVTMAIRASSVCRSCHTHTPLRRAARASGAGPGAQTGSGSTGSSHHPDV